MFKSYSNVFLGIPATCFAGNLDNDSEASRSSGRVFKEIRIRFRVCLLPVFRAASARFYPFAFSDLWNEG